MPKITENLRERTIGMLNAGMTMNDVAMSIGCSTRAIRHLRQRFQARRHAEDRPHSGRPRVTARGQDSYIGIPTCAIASKLQQLMLLTPMVHKTTVYLPKPCAIACAQGGLSARRPYVCCVLARRHRVNRGNWACAHQRWLRPQ